MRRRATGGRLRACALAAGLACAGADARGSTFYVATNGLNANPGSLAQPWATPGYASKQLAAGDTLIIRGGTYVLTNYYDDMLWTDVSGASNAWITMSGEPTNVPVLLGISNLLAAVSVADAAYLRVENLELCSRIDAPFSGGLRGGVDGLGARGESNIVLRNLSIHHVTETGIALDGNISNVVVDGCHIHHTGGSAISGDYVEPGDRGWQSVLITNCLLEHVGLFATNGLEQPSEWDRPDGVGFEASTGPVVIAGTTARFGFGDGLDSKARNTWIHHCVVANNYGDGVKLWGGGSRVENTLVYGTGFTVPALGSPWCLLVIDTQDAGATVEVINCTFFDDDRRANDQYAMIVQYDSPATPLRLILDNNIIAGLNRAYLAGSVVLAASNNLFCNRADPGGVQLTFGDTNDYTAAGLLALGAGNFSAAPQFMLGAWGSNADFRLQRGSPAVDAGGHGPSDDAAGAPRPVGAAWDLGAYEFGPWAAALAESEGMPLSTWIVASNAVYQLQRATGTVADTWADAASPFVSTSTVVSLMHTQEVRALYRLRQAP